MDPPEDPVPVLMTDPMPGEPPEDPIPDPPGDPIQEPLPNPPGDPDRQPNPDKPPSMRTTQPGTPPGVHLWAVLPATNIIWVKHKVQWRALF